MKILDLKKLLDEHIKLKFPNSPQNDELYDWFAELAETEPYYIGLIQRYIDGDIVDIDFNHIEELRWNLQNITISNLGEDSENYNYYSTYLDSLNTVVEEVKKVYENNHRIVKK